MLSRTIWILLANVTPANNFFTSWCVNFLKECFKYQLVYWKRHSAQQCLIALFEKIKGSIFTTLFAYRWKDFDCLQWCIHCKIICLWIWFQQRNKTDNMYNLRQNRLCRVLQWLILGPLLFSLGLSDRFFIMLIANSADENTSYGSRKKLLHYQYGKVFPRALFKLFGDSHFHGNTIKFRLFLNSN